MHKTPGQVVFESMGLTEWITEPSEMKACYEKYAAAVIAHIRPQIEAEARAEAIEDAAKAVEADGIDYAGFHAKMIRALASAPRGHVCVPVDDLDAPYALLKNIADNIRDEAPFRDQYIHKCKIIVGMIDGLLAARTK